jgi:phenylalanyl-tRNA synthetase beta chain
MQFTINKLKEFLKTNASDDVIICTLTKIGLEVEKVQDLSAKLDGFYLTEILEATPHPDADKLQICKVMDKDEKYLQIVCGAKNARPGLKTILAPIGIKVPEGDFKIKKSKIRGVESFGMLCSASELGLNDDSDGIIEVKGKVGDAASKILNLQDKIIEIAITPNRSDAISLLGIARDLSAAGIGELIDIKQFNFHLKYKIQ